MGETNDQDLTDMLRTAAPTTAPPAGFGIDDVVRASQKATARRRSAVAGGVAAVVLVLGGVTVGIAATGGGAETASSAAGGAPNLERGDAAVPPNAAAPTVPGPSDTGCVPMQDPGLRALLNEALPPVANAREAAVPMVCKQGGGREVALEVDDGPAHGVLSVVFTPAGEPVEDGQPVGWARAGSPTASGGYVAVTSVSDSDSGAIPFESQLATVASALAPRL
ncbi:MAG: hypothetical protein J0I34_24435 [Pseudonocardia sp.]|uniref:hypothetical protein n=1 Tax=unclassified Pseudonocardia TaxID=2619320 RepID=UPI00086ED5ED|nr:MULTISPECIES: hypothetical protein [unclassified Pseudonocardia]MBN9111918.1 hypothetical protein [Pseudonocardia sp.]ODU04321.1 MAG: hypothetical protein ABS80_26000 [Pseudonocardia sp. SCN 72-51]ODV06733.1 MAG: hypothetical protein ABT15_11090 [Pseudonocardia sp. SCN 73-27]